MNTIRAIDGSEFRSAPQAAAETFGALPDLQWIRVANLVVDPEYQREIRGDGRRNVRKIIADFRWLSFAPVIVAPIDGGRFAVVDGQHRSTAAAALGVEQVPCLVIKASRAEQARAFHEINGTVTKMSRQVLHHAMLAAGDASAASIDDVCKRASVEVLRYPVQTDNQRPGQTMAVGTIAKCLRIYGRDILVTALQCVTETENKENAGLLVGPVIRGLCHFLKENKSYRDAGEKLLQAFDLVDIGEVSQTARYARRSKGETVATVFAGLIKAKVAEALVEVERDAKASARR